MNIRINSLLSIILMIGLVLASCDRVEDDTFPVGDALFTPEIDSRTITPGSSVIIDLSTSIQASQPVTFRTGEAPARGRVSFHSNGLMEYAPDDSFSSGTDDFTVEMVNEDSVVLDAEEFTISMVSEEGELPCFNGALGDYAWTGKGLPVIIYPLVNDGFCETEIESFSFRTDQPEHGEVNLVSPLEVAYIPDSDFIGLDEFFYTLTLIDQSGNEFISTARVEVEVSDEYPYYEQCLEQLLQFSEEPLFLPTGDGDQLLVELDIEDCVGNTLDVIIEYVLYGEAEIDGDLLLYQPGVADDSTGVDVIGLKLVFGQDTLVIDLPVIVDHEPFDCENEAFPNPHLVLEDEELEPVYQVSVFNENVFCAFLPWSLEIVEANQGTAELGDDGISILWYPGDEPLDSMVIIHYNIVFEDGSFLERCVSIYRDDFLKQLECFESSFPSQSFVIEELDLEYEFELYIPVDDCEIPQWDIVILETIHGTVDVAVDENILRFYPDEGPNADGYYGVIYEVVLISGETAIREIILQVDDSFHFECIEQFIHPDFVSITIDQLEEGNIPIFELSEECSLQIDSLEVIESELGAASFDGAKVLWTPNDMFIDHALVVLMVVLPETGEVYEKLIEIVLEDDPFRACGEAAFPEQYLALDRGDESYTLPIYFIPPDCVPEDWTLVSVETTNGEVDIAANGEDLVWYPNYDEFNGYASIVYVVNLADESQIESQIELEFKEEQDCFDEAFPNQEIYLGTPNNIVFQIPVIFPTSVCLFPEWEIEITSVSSGSAYFDPSTGMIIYTIDSMVDFQEPEVKVEYDVVFAVDPAEPGDERIARQLILIFDGSGDVCAQAFADEYFYSPLQVDTSDVNLPVVMPLIMSPADNDFYCTDQFEINILEHPDIGEAVVLDGQLIEYQVFEEFAGRRETVMKYEICDSGQCDDNYIYITVEQ
ncbi:MAG: hypothetical protein AAGC88_01110 [Bacteroidota bacterium]